MVRSIIKAVIALALGLLGVYLLLFVRQNILVLNPSFRLSTDVSNALLTIEHPVTIRYYLPLNSEQLPSEWRFHSHRSVLLLREVEKLLGDKIDLEVVDTSDRDGFHEAAQKLGIDSIRIGAADVLWGIAVESSSRVETIPKFDLGRLVRFEDVLGSLILKLGSKKKKIAVLSDFVMKDRDGKIQKNWLIFDRLSAYYRVEVLERSSELPADADLMMLFLVSDLSESQTRSLKEYVERGGMVVLAVDPFSRVRQVSDDIGEETVNADGQPLLRDLLNKWGLEYNPYEVIGDKQFASPVYEVGRTVSNPFLLRIDSFFERARFGFLGGVSHIAFAESGFFSIPHEILEGSFEPLIVSSKNASSIRAEAVRFKTLQELSDELVHTVGSVALVGIRTFKSRSQALVVFGDIDFFTDRYTRFDKSSAFVSSDIYDFDNLKLVEDLVAYLLFERGLIGNRSTLKSPIYAAWEASGEIDRLLNINHQQEDLRRDHKVLNDRIMVEQQALTGVDHHSFVQRQNLIQSLREEKVAVLKASYDLGKEKDALGLWYLGKVGVALIFCVLVPGILRGVVRTLVD